MHMLNNKSTVDMIYLDFTKAFDKVDHGILLHKLRHLEIRGRPGLWFFHFPNNRQHYVRIPGGISQHHPVLSGVPQGTVLGPLLFLIMIIDIDKGISPSSKLVSFADDTRVYSCINDIENCDQLQIDHNSVYHWAHVNNMFFNAQKFNYVSFNGSMTPKYHKIGYHVYADDTQLYISFKCKQPLESISKVNSCLSDIRRWMITNKLKINDSKTEFIVFRSPQLRCDLSGLSVNVGECW